MEYTYTKKIFAVYLKFEFNWASCIFIWQSHISEQEQK